MAEQDKFESWAVVELFGHQQIAGRVTEATIGGCAFLRVDVPEQPAQTKVHAWDSDEPAVPPYTRYFGNGAIYAVNPCSEEIAMRTARQIRKRPPIAYDSGRPALAAPSEGGGFDFDQDQQ